MKKNCSRGQDEDKDRQIPQVRQSLCNLRLRPDVVDAMELAQQVL